MNKLWLLFLMWNYQSDFLEREKLQWNGNFSSPIYFYHNLYFYNLYFKVTYINNHKTNTKLNIIYYISTVTKIIPYTERWSEKLYFSFLNIWQSTLSRLWRSSRVTMSSELSLLLYNVQSLTISCPDHFFTNWCIIKISAVSPPVSSYNPL